jgi:predicted metallo-beta-lactamase superfamily hydrolase
MTQSEILAEVKKATDLWMDKTYNESEFYSHILSIINDNTASAELHVNQLERLMFKVEEMRTSQRLYHGGDRSRLGQCKTQEVDMDKKIMYLKTVKGYNSDRFKAAKPMQKNIF